VDAKQLAFEIKAIEMGANWAFQFFGDKQAFIHARAAGEQDLFMLSA
jgi:hypothetical protein